MPNRQFKLYDTLTRQVKPLELVEPGHLRFYSCGPTVYSYAHIGNFRTFLTADLVVRTAEALGWRVSYVTNITDVGHLTQDDVADSAGEDRMEKALRSKEGESFANVWDLAEYYADVLKEDWRKLNLHEPYVRPKATQHMREQIAAVMQLIEQGNAYETPTGVYFSIASFPGYGTLSGNTDQSSLIREVREVVSDDNKKHPADFALWKKDEKHLMQWFSPWGWGFPGWHIECSVMARAYLGDTIDLHAGGEDLVFPHHECEIAQSESITKKPFSNHWMHTRFLQVDGEKMSKRFGNFFTIRDLVDDNGFDPLAIRYALISVPYGRPFNLTTQTLHDASKNVERFRECDSIAAKAAESNVAGNDSVGQELEQLYEATLDAMCDDLNTSVAIAKALEGTGVIFRANNGMTKASGVSAVNFLNKINALLGIVRSDYGHTKVVNSDDDSWILEKIAERDQAKKGKDFTKADAIRAELDAKGIELRDSPDGTTWKRKVTIGA